ncbi:MAG: ribosome small subunit-dependent GTPase A [bacterium]|nr:ribosome small subunit-dependent GTPase A [bacterium]MDD5757172.1 ribosome small subunit-dependent GTPase A [bacterium]
MELIKLGFDDWFEDKARLYALSGYQLARIAAVDKDSYVVIGEKNEVFAEIEGKLRFQAVSSLDLPTVGDWVYVKYYNDDTLAIIHEILPRRSLLRRKTAGKKIDYQLLSANIDTAFIMQSLDANFNLRRLERYLVAVKEGGIEPVALLSKADLIPEKEIQERIAAIRQVYSELKVMVFSNKTGLGLEDIQRNIEPGRTYALLGSSGVGKTTLLNKLIGEDIYKTAEVRVKDAHGRHTTSRRQLTILDSGGLLIDTPGMREFGNISIATGLNETFNEISSLAQKCRFKDCTHTNEPGCAILAALNNGQIPAERLNSFQKLQKEARYNEMSYVEKRKKDKDFGKYVKNILKEIKKYK